MIFTMNKYGVIGFEIITMDLSKTKETNYEHCYEIMHELLLLVASWTMTTTLN